MSLSAMVTHPEMGLPWAACSSGNPLGENSFPNIQFNPPLVQLGAISFCPVACNLGEETAPPGYTLLSDSCRE